MPPATLAPRALLDRRSLLGRLLGCALSMLSAGMAQADPGYYVVTAYDNAGVTSLDTRFWSVKPKHGQATLWPEYGVGYGVSTRWYTEVFASYIGGPQQGLRLNTWNWQNEYLLTQGQYPVDLALHGQLIREQSDGHATSFEFGPVFQTDIGRTQLNLNLFFDHTWGGEAYDDNAGGTQLKYQWQLRYRWVSLLNVGLQGFGEVGRWNHWSPRDEQSHRAGPAIFGTLRLGSSGQKLNYQAAYLIGSTYETHGAMFSARIQYAF